MSSGARFSPGVETKKVVNRSTFFVTLIVMLILVIIFMVLTIVFFFLYRRTLANLENNICPVCP